MSTYNESNNNENEFEKIDVINLMQSFWQGLKKLWWLVVGLTILSAVFSYFSTTSSYQSNYVASATMAVRGVGNTVEFTDMQSAQQMAEVFPYILTSGVLKDVIAEDMGLDYIPGTISAKADEGTNFLTVSVSSTDAQQAYDILQSVITNYPKVAQFVIGEVQLDILDETGVPKDTEREAVIHGSYKRGALKGLLLALCIVAVYVMTRKNVKSRKVLKTNLNIEDIGTIPFVLEKKRKKSKNHNRLNLMNERIPQGYLEAIRKIRIKVMKEMEDKGYKSLLVTSSIPGEGKTTVAVNLAMAIAKQGKKVILVDCDLRNPTVASVMNEKEPHPGLGAVLRRKTDLGSALTRIEIKDTNFAILYGSKPRNDDAKLLGTMAMEKLIHTLEEMADVVIFDTPPSELLADTPILSRYVDAALYVVKYDHTRLQQIREGVRALGMSGINILGYVFNADKEVSGRGGYGYKRYGKYSSYYGGYGRYGKYGESGKRIEKSGRVIKD